MKMMFAVIICKIVNFASKITGGEASAIGGYLALKADKNILKKIKYPKYVIGIIGTNDKRDVIELVAHILKESNYSICYNADGNKTKNSIISLIIENSTLKGNFKKDVLLIEFNDKELLKEFDLTHLLVINKSEELSYLNSLNSKCKLILNVNSILSKDLIINNQDNISFYNINKHELSNFELKKINYLAHNINTKDRVMFINNNKVNLPYSSFKSAYTTLAAYSLCKELNLNNEKILYALNENIIKFNNTYNIGNRKLQMITSKNENNLNYKQSLEFISKEPGFKTIIFGFENSNRRYTENDISWIWSIDFELLKSKNINKILITGKFKQDILVRMNYAGIKKEKLILVDQINNIFQIIKNNTKGSIYSMVCFDTEIILKGLLKNEKDKN